MSNRFFVQNHLWWGVIKWARSGATKWVGGLWGGCVYFQRIRLRMCPNSTDMKSSLASRNS